MKTWLCLVVFSITLISCTPNKKNNGILWHKTGMENALKKAQEEKKPLFVYWGASWCPPCATIKSKVFTYAPFIKVTQNYIPVYLDGDSKSAQEWGEKLKARGYPTLMVLSPKGIEITRLSSSLSKQSFTEALSYLYTNLNPIKDIIKKVLSSSATKGDWQRIVNYSWGQDSDVQKNQKQWLSTFKELESKIPSNFKREKSQIFITYLEFLLNQPGEKKISRKQLSQFKDRIKEILNSNKLAEANLSSLSYSADLFAKHFFPKPSKEKTSFLTSYLSRMTILRKNSKTIDDRLSTLFPILTLSPKKENKIQLNDSDKNLITLECLSALKNSKSGYERLSTLNNISYILMQIGKIDQTRTLLEQELTTALNPHYIMSSLSHLEKKSGDKKKSLEWSQKAYLKSKGEATRLQWAAKHLINLISLAPQKHNEILNYIKELFSENLKMDDAFVGRNKRVLDKVSKEISQWSNNQKQRSKIKVIKNSSLSNCSKPNFYKNQFYKNFCIKYFTALKV